MEKWERWERWDNKERMADEYELKCLIQDREGLNGRIRHLSSPISAALFRICTLLPFFYQMASMADIPIPQIEERFFQFAAEMECLCDLFRRALVLHIVIRPALLQHCEDIGRRVIRSKMKGGCHRDQLQPHKRRIVGRRIRSAKQGGLQIRGSRPHFHCDGDSFWQFQFPVFGDIRQEERI